MPETQRCCVCSEAPALAGFRMLPDGRTLGPLCEDCRAAAQPYVEYWANHVKGLRDANTRFRALEAPTRDYLKHRGPAPDGIDPRWWIARRTAALSAMVAALDALTAAETTAPGSEENTL